MAEQYRRSLREFTKAAWPTIEPGVDFQNNWHIDAISDHLEAVVNGDIKRLIINVPPRHMKSISVAVAMPAWTWVSQPHKKFLYASYAASLSIRDSTKCRRLIDSPWYKAHFGDKFRLTDDQNQKQRFENDKTGYRIATSVNGALTGDGGDLIVIDDPHNSVEADSAKVREGVLEWWDQAMQTRLNDPRTGAFVIIMQRLHEQDLTGHVLSNQLGNEWSHLCLPARYEIGHPTPSRSPLGFIDPRSAEGELLWPERIDDKTLSNLERSLGTYAAAGQLQQRPSPRAVVSSRHRGGCRGKAKKCPRTSNMSCNLGIQPLSPRKAPALAPEPLGAYSRTKASCAPSCLRLGMTRSAIQISGG
jgi:hypothetical protein